MAASEEIEIAPRGRQAVAEWWQPHATARYAAGMVAALAYYYLMPDPLLALPGLAAFAVLAWRRLDLALCLLPLTFPFWYVPKRALGAAVFPLSEIALGVCLAVALAQVLRSMLAREARARTAWHALGTLRGHALRWLVGGAVLLLLGVAVGVLIAVRSREALRAFRWEVAEPLLYAGLVLAYLWVRPHTRRDGEPASNGMDATAGREHGADGEALAWLAGPALAVAALFGALAIAQVLWLRVGFTPLATGNRLAPLGSVAEGSLVRATAIYYGSPNSLGALLERMLPLALALLLWRLLDAAGPSRALRGQTERANGSSSQLVRGMGSVGLLALTGSTLLMIVGLALSQSRGAEVGAAAGLLLVLLAHPRTRRVAVAIAALGLVAALWQGGTLVSAALAGHNDSGEVRLLLWQSALHMIRDHPLLGIGPDQFLYYYDPAYTAHPYWIPLIGGHLTPAASQPDLAHPHNLALDLWLSGGMLALIGFAVVIGWFARRWWQVWHAGQRAAGAHWTARAALGAGLTGGVLAGLVHGMVDSAYFQPDLALFFWWAVALTVIVTLPRIDSAASGRPPETNRSAAPRETNGTGRS
jgi:putative inorganic carbon (HCO3(-)) transporter